MKKNRGWIINSLMDLDCYKLTMGQFVLHRYSEVQIRAALNNRTKSVQLAACVPRRKLKRQLDHVRTLRVKDAEIEFLRSVKQSDGEQRYKEDYLFFLRNLRFGDYRLRVMNGQFRLTFSGPWVEVIYWETIALSILNELYYRAIVKDMNAAEEEGLRRLMEKIDRLRLFPLIMIIEFGTRRRFSREWQERVLTMLIAAIPDQLLGTSNVYLAMKYEIPMVGTMAHELFMVIAAINDETDESLRSSHNLVLREWWDEYGADLSIALTDTFGTDFFFQDMTEEQAHMWRGGRQDSGDPFEYGRKAQAFYQKYGIDTKTKMMVPSDGLDLDLIISIWEEFHDTFQLAYGWGTNLTNDLGFAALSLVIKVINANKRRTVKLSDNMAKAMGDPKDVERYKQTFDHTTTFTQATRY